MKRLLFLLLFLALATFHAPAELGHKFPPIKPEELAKMQAALPRATVKPAKPRKLLVFYLTEGYVHASIPYCNEAIKEIGEKTGAYTADFSEDMAVFTPDNLKQYDAVLFNNTTGLKFVDFAARQALIDFAQSGKGIIGIHAATDNFPTWEPGQALLGGKFDGHPWGAGDIEAVKVDEPANPLVASFGGKGFWINDEIYQMRAPYDRSQVRELLSLDMSKPQNARDPKKIHRTDNDFPICWVKQVEGGGRVFYCSLGHNPSVFWTPQVLQVYLNGIQYALGDLPVDATPSGKLSPQPVAALAPETPDPINPKPVKPVTAPPAAPTPKPTAINGGIRPFVSMILSAEISATTDVSTAKSDPLADGVKAVSAYNYGADRTDIVAFDNYIRSQPSESRGKIEAALLPLLSQAGISDGAKDYICRWLAMIGSDPSIPVLKKLTDDPKWSHLAVYALLSIGTPAAKSALVDSLGQAPAALRPAIIGAIGRADIAEAVPNLAQIATLSDEAQGAAALDALGALGTPESLAALSKTTVPASLEITRQWALIHAATRVLALNPSENEGAKAVYASLLKPGSVSSLRVAAAKGYLEADPSGAWPVISNLLKDDDAKVRLDVARLTPQLSADAIAFLITAVPGLDPAVQVVIINSLAEKQNTGIEPVLKTALASNQPDVHLAAISGYGTANLPGSVSTLLPFLDKGADEAVAATGSLEKLSQPDASAALNTALTQAQGPAKAALLTILAARTDRSALDTVFASTGDADSRVAEAAFQGINLLADGSDLNRVVDLLPGVKTASERKALESALFRCARSAADKDKTADFLLAALKGASPENRSAFIVALASVNSPKASSGLQSLLQAPSVDDRKNVIRALSSAHNPDADKLLLQAASHSSEPSEKILALRGYLDSIRAQNLSEPKKVEAYKVAWPLATRPDDQQAILDALKNMKGDEARKALDKLAPNVPKPA